jgi:hypothetical protein
MRIANVLMQIQQRRDTRRQDTWRRWGLVYDPSLLTQGVINDLKAIRSLLNQINRVEMKRARLDACRRLHNATQAKGFDYRIRLLKEEHRLVRQSKQHITAVITALEQPHALAELLDALGQREVGLQEEIDQPSATDSN